LFQDLRDEETRPKQVRPRVQHGLSPHSANFPAISNLHLDKRLRIIISYNKKIWEVINMPIYEYRCKKCGEVSEYIQKFSDAPITDCEKCGSPGTLEKLMSLSSFQLKGSGWYLTDYARKNMPNKESAGENKTTERNKTKPAGETNKNQP